MAIAKLFGFSSTGFNYFSRNYLPIHHSEKANVTDIFYVRTLTTYIDLQLTAQSGAHEIATAPMWHIRATANVNRITAANSFCLIRH